MTETIVNFLQDKDDSNSYGTLYPGRKASVRFLRILHLEEQHIPLCWMCRGTGDPSSPNISPGRQRVCMDTRSQERRREMHLSKRVLTNLHCLQGCVGFLSQKWAAQAFLSCFAGILGKKKTKQNMLSTQVCYCDLTQKVKGTVSYWER